MPTPTLRINLSEKLSLFSDEWSPKIIAESNGQLVKLAKCSGELMWHAHEHEDELFLVVKGKLTLKMRDRSVTLLPGELFVVPKGIEHCPMAEEDTHMIIIEPASTQHTGTIVSDRTVAVSDQPWI